MYLQINFPSIYAIGENNFARLYIQMHLPPSTHIRTTHTHTHYLPPTTHTLPPPTHTHTHTHTHTLPPHIHTHTLPLYTTSTHHTHTHYPPQSYVSLLNSEDKTDITRKMIAEGLARVDKRKDRRLSKLVSEYRI